ncbi:MAG: endo-1,4-beta-xylanase [Chloroflexota bacterium]
MRCPKPLATLRVVSIVILFSLLLFSLDRPAETPAVAQSHVFTNVFPTSRSPVDWPFRWDSIWNLPVGDGAIYIPAGIRPATQFGVFADEDILILAPDAPLVDVIAHNADWDPERPRCESIVSPTQVLMSNVPVPFSFSTDPGADGTPNQSAAILMPDGITIRQTQPLHRCGAGGPVVSQYNFPDDNIKTGDGIPGAHGGSSLSSMGGSIRLGELVSGGTLRHALKLVIDSRQYTAYNADDGTPGYRWPATSADFGAENDYGGEVPQLEMGALLALKPDFNVDELRTEPAKILARALIDYGGYLVDSAGWDAYYFATEWGSNGRVLDEFEEVWGFPFLTSQRSTCSDLSDASCLWSKDMTDLFINLHVIDNNTLESIGGPGIRRQPCAPPFADGTGAAPAYCARSGNQPSDPPTATSTPVQEATTTLTPASTATMLATSTSVAQSTHSLVPWLYIPLSSRQSSSPDSTGPPETSSPTPALTFTPTSTPTPTASIDPSDLVRTLNRTLLYSGPDNVDHLIQATLAADVFLKPLGRYGEFIKIERVADQQQAIGYVWQEDVDVGSNDISTLLPSELPSILNDVVPSDYPLTFDLIDPDNYRTYPLFGSATLPNRDTTVQVSLSIVEGETMPPFATNGIFFGTYQRRIYLAYQQGIWKLIYGEGDTYPISQDFTGMTAPSAELALRLTTQNRMAIVTLPDGEEVTVDLGKSIFSPDETLYLFAQTAPNSVTTVNSATIEQLPSGTYHETLALADPPLRRLTAAHGITYGSIHDTGELGSWLDFKLLDRHADLLVWHLGWSFSDTNMPLENAYAELRSSTRVAHARTVGQRVRVHPLLWYLDIPNWVSNGNYSQEELSQIMENRITSLMTQHQAEEWVVLNEAIVDGEGGPDLRSNIFQDTFGEEHIDMAFRFARAAAPDAILLYNDYGVEEINTKSNRMLSLVQRMVDRDVPIDGVGLQFHMLGCQGTSAPTKEQYKENMARFAALGLDLYVTELDVNLNGLSGTQSEKWAIQADIYRDVTEACIETPACKSVTTWGLRDSTSWWYPNMGCGDNPLIFDDDYHPKPSYVAMQEALLQHPTSTPASR